MRTPTALLLLAALAAPLALGQAAEGDLSILVYHAPGGPEPDPLATPLAPPPPDADRLPATFFDRTERASSSPENQPASAPAHYRELQRLLTLRSSVPPPVRITLGGSLAPGALEVVANVSSDEPLPARVELVVFEHDEGLYAARFADVLFEERLPVNVDRRIALDPAWSPEKLGVVLIVVAEGEVAQSATWLVRDDAPTVQVERAVLLEHVTASWCTPCRPADDALALLAEQRGPAGGLPSSGDPTYLRAPTGWLWLGLALGGAAGIALARRSAS